MAANERNRRSASIKIPALLFRGDSQRYPYSDGQVIRLLKSITAKKIFREAPEVKKELWGGEFWTEGYYFATISGRGDKAVIERYI